MAARYDKEMHSTHNEGKFVVAERLIRIFKTKLQIYDSNIKKCVH